MTTNLTIFYTDGNTADVLIHHADNDQLDNTMDTILEEGLVLANDEYYS